jgi:hypothetical protein
MVHKKIVILIHHLKGRTCAEWADVFRWGCTINGWEETAAHFTSKEFERNEHYNSPLYSSLHIDSMQFTGKSLLYINAGALTELETVSVVQCDGS